jgi:hypothetical protein
MINREKIIENYIDAYNCFDTDKMITDFDKNIIFENVQNGETNMSLKGLNEFMQQAEQAKTYFSKRTQTIKSFTHSDNITEIQIDYNAIVGMDFPNGLKKGQEINLTGKSIFEFDSGKIIKLTDIS